MPQTNDIGPMDETETVVITWDFTKRLLSGVTVASVVSTSAVVSPNSPVDDPNVATRLKDTPLIGSAPPPPYGTGGANLAVRQAFKQGVAGCIYVVSCLANTSDGQQLNLFANLPCVSAST